MSCRTLVDKALRHESWDAVALQGQTPLARAAQHASLDLVEVLLAAGALPHGTGPQVSSNSHAYNSCTPYAHSCAVQVLLHRPARVNSSQAQPFTALMHTPACCEANMLQV